MKNNWKTATIILGISIFILLLINFVSSASKFSIPGTSIKLSNMDLNKISSHYVIGEENLICCSENECLTIQSKSALEKFNVDINKNCILVTRIG